LERKRKHLPWGEEEGIYLMEEGRRKKREGEGKRCVY